MVTNLIKKNGKRLVYCGGELVSFELLESIDGVKLIDGINRPPWAKTRDAKNLTFSFEYTDRFFWEKLSADSLKWLDEDRIKIFLKDSGLDQRLSSSLLFYLRFQVTEVLFERCLVHRALVENDCDQVVCLSQKSSQWIGGNVLSEVAPQNNIRQKIKRLKGFKLIKSWLVKILRNLAFWSSLIWGFIFFRGQVLGFSPNSKLKNTIKYMGSDRTFYALGISSHLGWIPKIISSFGFQNAALLALPIPQPASKMLIDRVHLHFDPDFENIGKLINEFEFGDDSNCFINLKISLTQGIAAWVRARQRDFHVASLIIRFVSPSIYIAQHSLDLSSVIALEAKSVNVPTKLITHGSHVVTGDFTADIEWKNHANTMIFGPFDQTLIQTPAAWKFYRDYKFSNCFGLVSFPHMFFAPPSNPSNVRSKLYGVEGNVFVLLHASTPKPRSYLRPLVYESVDEYIQNLVDLIEAIRDRSDIFLAIRFRPFKGLTARGLELLLPATSNWKIFQNGVFSDYLTLCDALISYSSTTIEEALYAGKPIVLWPGKAGYQHINPKHILGPTSVPINGVWMSDKSNIIANVQEIIAFKDEMSSTTIQFQYKIFLSERTIGKLEDSV